MPKNGHSENRNDSWRTLPMYTFREAAHLAHVSPATVRNWLFGYSSNTGYVLPPLFPAAEQTAQCSFLQLVEIIVAAQFRKAEHKSFHTVRKAHENARALWNLEYPFADLRLESIGGHIVHIIENEEAIFQAIDEPEQWTLPGLVQATINQLDYEFRLAARWYPKGKNVPIVVDPRISAGVPVVLGSGVAVEVIRKRFTAGQRIDFIASDFELDRDAVEEVVRYAQELAA